MENCDTITITNEITNETITIQHDKIVKDQSSFTE